MDAAGVAGLIVAGVSIVTAVSPLLTRGALRWKLKHDAAVLKDLPEGPVKNRMLSLLELEISQLQTEQELHVFNEERWRGNGLMFLGSALWVLPYLATLPDVLSLAVPTMAVIFFFFGAIKTSIAIWTIRPRRRRRPPPGASAA